MKTFKFMLLISLACLLIFSCSDKSTNSSSDIRELTPEELKLAGSGNSFGFKIFNEVNQFENNEDTSIFISPISISMALGMAYNGAAGETRTAIQDVLDLNGLTLEEINISYKSLIQFLTGLDSKVIFEAANSNWIRTGFPVKQNFTDLNKTYFNAEVNILDFDEAACSRMNAWCDEKTHGKITQIINPPISDMAMLILINAIYFKGDWTYQFDPDETEERPFYLADGSTANHFQMSQKADFPYYEDSTIQVIDLPYGNEHFSMTIFLPAYGTDINQFISEFNQDLFEDLIGNLNVMEVNLFMPKFKLESGYKLNDILTTLGMGIAFSPVGADFSNISDIFLFISQVIHKTFIEVDEEGTEAAAVTAVIFETTSLPDNIYMTINRPFVFVIRDNISNSMLFMGKIVCPKE
ncbi:MAG: serpin family protein [Candidatus Zixiibacteriota bacterium]